MVSITPVDRQNESAFSSNIAVFAEHKRSLTSQEIDTLIQQGNTNSDSSWQNIFVPKEDGLFDVSLIRDCEFSGFVVLGRLTRSVLKYHDLELCTGLYHSYITDVVLGDDVCIRNVQYLVNYHIGSRVILFNIQEMSCTHHSKFGAGILKEGEPESNRVWIGISNENDARAVLPFEKMLPADAFIWSRRRDDNELLAAFVRMTEQENDRKNNTFGIIADDVVIKNTLLLKDVKVGSGAYIKGACKLKNITVCSSEEEPSQIGEGVELVNGIMGYGSKVFYQAIAVRFVIGRNCQLKYGARLLNSVLGDNSTVSCCELLNNLIFPFHEQHHNTSFLIASTVLGQSNIAAGATIGSNHNSRSPDGEIFAGRGFWPGLCSDFKHNSRFASFTLVSKGSYQNELNIMYPFSLVSIDSTEQAVHIIPAYWFLYNMFAISRNKSKFRARDRRVIKAQHIETDPLAPDTVQEIMYALDRLIVLTARYLKKTDPLYADIRHDISQQAKDFLHQNPDTDIELYDPQCQKRYGARILKVAQGYREYRRVAKYFAVSALMEYCVKQNINVFSPEVFASIKEIPLYTDWENVGGQIIPRIRIEFLYKQIKNGRIQTWDAVHAFYEDCQVEYLRYKTRYALHILESLYERAISQFDATVYTDIYTDVAYVANYMYESAVESRKKDYTDYFRTITFRNAEEMTAVLGTLDANEFLNELKADTTEFCSRLNRFFSALKK